MGTAKQRMRQSRAFNHSPICLKSQASSLVHTATLPVH